MGLYNRVKARKKASTPEGGLLRRSLESREPPERRPVPRPAAAEAAAAAAPPRARGRAAAVPAAAAAAEAPAPRADGLSSAIARIENGFDAPPVLFDLIASSLRLSRAALLVADYARGTFAPCALRGPRAGLAQPVTGWVERLFGSKGVRRLDARQAASFGEFAAGMSDLRVMPYMCSDAPAGMLVFAPPGDGADEKAISAALGHEEICTRLEWVSAQLTEMQPFPLENLEGVHPAGPSMMLSISTADATAALAQRAPSLNSAWLADILQRLIGRLVAPLGRIGVRSGSPVAVLTQRGMDAELLRHQIATVLAQGLRSLRPLPAPVVTQLA